MAANRVLVYMKRAADQNPVKLRFIQSTVSLLNDQCPASGKDDAETFFKVEDGKFLLSNSSLQGFSGPVTMKRPAFCPMKTISKEEVETLPTDIQERGVDTGAAVLVESADGKILLIRRAFHLRTFPGVWVPPGGHVDVGEQVVEAALRELDEEAGIKLTSDMCENGRDPVLALWESTFPPMLAMGSPVRHHIVTYIHVKLKPPHTSDSILVNPDPEEVGAATWLDRNLIQGIVHAHDPTAPHTTQPSKLPEIIKVLMVERGIPNYTIDYETSRLLQQADGQKPDRERVSTGTIWALTQWLTSSR